MLVFHNHCQLGNQMFIYACAHSLAKEKQVKYCLSQLKDLSYFELAKEDKWNSIKFIAFRIKNLFIKYKFEHLQDNRRDYSEELKKTINKDTWYYGYFQGEKYFYDNIKEIKARFKIKSEVINQFNLLKNKEIGNKEYTIIHIRLKDYKTFGPRHLNGPDLTLPFSYYHNLIRKVLAKDKEQQFVFLSDDINQIKNEFNYVKNAYFSLNSPIIDLQFIIKAQTCILSCSTFSWWGAWLNENIKKCIYVPKNFLGFKVNKEYPINIIPKNWNQVEIYNN